MAQRLAVSAASKLGTRAPAYPASRFLDFAGIQGGGQQQRRDLQTSSIIKRTIPETLKTPNHVQIRYSSHSPMGATSIQRKKVTIDTLRKMHAKKDPITMITAHDFPSAHVADHAGMDMILVGDSLAMVALGMEDTSEVLLEEMILHCRSVSRATKAAFTVGDLPMGSYEISPEQALESSIRLIKEGRVQSVKLEGGAEMAPTIKKLTQSGIAVLAHIGLTPQRQNSLGGFRVQGKSTEGAMKLLEDALAVQDAGAFGVVIEAVPEELAADITARLMIPTIGIGAGKATSGQVLVQVDMLGHFPHGRFLPKFVKKYGDLWGESLRAIQAYKDDVKAKAFPAIEHTYPMPQDVQKAVNDKFALLDQDIEDSYSGNAVYRGDSSSIDKEDDWSRYRSEMARLFRSGSLNLGA